MRTGSLGAPAQPRSAAAFDWKPCSRRVCVVRSAGVAFGKRTPRGAAMASPGASRTDPTLHVFVKVDRSRLQGAMRLSPEAAGGSSCAEEADDAGAQVSKIKKKKISPSTPHYPVEEDKDQNVEAKKIKKKKNSASGLHHSGEREGGVDEDKKTKKKKTSGSGSHHSHEESHKADGTGGTGLKREQPAPRHSDMKKEEKDKIKEALQKRCVVKIEKHAAISLRREAVAVAAGGAAGEVRCAYCSRSFRTVAGMRVHRTRIHFQKEGNAPWCALCRQAFQDVRKLNRHSKRCAGLQTDVPGPLSLQSTSAGFLVPSPRRVQSTPRDEQPVFGASDEGGLSQTPVVAPKYQFPSPILAGVLPVRAADKEKHISFGKEESEPTVESPARSPRRKSLRPRKVVKPAAEPAGDNPEWEGASAALWQDGERRVQPSRSAKSAVESYCECSKSGPEDSQDGDTGKVQAEGCAVHNTPVGGDVAQLGAPPRGGHWAPVTAGVQTWICPIPVKQHQAEREGRAAQAAERRPKKKETGKSRQTLLVRPNRPQISSVGNVRREPVAGGRMKARVPQVALTVGGCDGPNWDDARLLVQKNCLPVTEMVRMSMIPSVRRDESNCQEAPALYVGNLVTAGPDGLYKHYYLSGNEQSQSRHVSPLNTNTNKSENETQSLFENPYVGEQQSSLNSTAQMNNRENEDRNSSTDRTNPSYICHKPPRLRVVKVDTGTLIEINTDAPLNLSTHTPADKAANTAQSNFNVTGAATHTEEDYSKVCDKSGTHPQNGSPPQRSQLQQVNVHLNNAPHDVIQSGKDVHKKGIAAGESVRDAAMDLRKVLGKSPVVPGGTEEVTNFVLRDSNCPPSDLGGEPGMPIKAGESCDTPDVEAEERPTCEDRLETEAADGMARSPSQFSESEDIIVLDSVHTAAASSDDEASDGSETVTCDEPSQAWSPDHQSENGDRHPSAVNSNGPVSSTTSIAAIYNDSSSRSQLCDSRHHSPAAGNSAEREAGRGKSPSSGRCTGNASRPSRDSEDGTAPSPAGVIRYCPADESVCLQTADSTTEDPVLEQSNVTRPLSLAQSPCDETSQSQPVDRNIVEDVEIRDVNGENPNNTLKEGNPSKLPESSGGNVTFLAPNDSKSKNETEGEKESQDATLACIETMKKMLETIPKPPQSPARELATQTEDQKAYSSGDSGKLAEPVIQSQDSVPLFLVPRVMTALRAPTPRTITVPKDLSEYESSSSGSCAENIAKTLASPPADEGLSQVDSRMDLCGEDLSQDSLSERPSVLRSGSAQTSFPGSGGSNPPGGTVETVTNYAVQPQGVIVGTDLRAKVGTAAREVKAKVTADSWLAVSPLPYGVQRVLCSSPKSPASPVSPLAAYVGRGIPSPLSPLVGFECIRSPQNELGSKMQSSLQTGERQSPLVDDAEPRDVSAARLPPFATLAKSLAEIERPNRPYSLPAGVKMELTKVKQNGDETHKLDAEPPKTVNASPSAGTGNEQSVTESKPSPKLAECSSPDDEELCILYEHRPHAINLSLQDRPSSAPLANSDQKGQPDTGSFCLKSDTESHQKETLMMQSDADQSVYHKENTSQGFLSSGTEQAPMAAATYSYSQQPQPALDGGRHSNSSVKNTSHSTSQYKGDSPHQGVTRASWPVFESDQMYQRNKTGSGPTMHGVIVQGKVNNTLSDTTNATWKNAPHSDAKGISSFAGGEVDMCQSTREGTNQSTMTQGQSTLPNLPDIIGCRMADSVADTVGSKQTDRGSGGLVGSGRRGRGGRREPPGRDDAQPCECPCGKVCKNYRGLEQHKARAHRDVVFFRGDGGESCGSWPHVLGPRSFRCPCGARFGRLDAIKKHFAAEQAETGGRRWWISDRVPICTCRQTDRGTAAGDYGPPPQSFGYLQSHCGAGLASQPTSCHVYPQQAWPGTTLHHQGTLGQPKQSWPSALETRGSHTTDVRGLQNLPAASYGGVIGQYGGNNNPAGLWAPPFPVSRAPSQSMAGVIKPAHTTGQHSAIQNSTSEWWSPAQSSVAQLSPSIQMLASMQDSSNVARNPVQHYNLSSDASRQFQHTVPTLAARHQEMAVTRTGTNAERLQQLTTGGADGWGHSYGGQATDGRWAQAVAGAFSGQQQNKSSFQQGYHHTSRVTPQPGLADPTASRQGQQSVDLDISAVGDSRPEPQRWDFQHPRSPALYSAAQARPKQKLPFTHQEFCSTQQNAAPFHWGSEVLPTPPAAHGGPVTSATGGRPSQSLEQTQYSGAMVGLETTPQLPCDPTSGVQGRYPGGVCSGPAFQAKGEQPAGVAGDTGGSAAPVARKDDPKWKLLPNSKARED